MVEDDDKKINPEEGDESTDENQPEGESTEKNEFDDDFGLDDDVSLEAVDRDQEEETSAESSTEDKPAFDPTKDQQKSRAPLIIGLIVALIVLGGAGYYFFVVIPENQRQEELAHIEIEKAKKAEEKRLAREAEEKGLAEEEARLAQEEAVAEAEPETETGEITTITQKTGRSYVVVGSFVDSDFANDYSIELAAKGANPKILVPDGGKGFHRVAVGDFETFVEAENRANEVRTDGDFGDQVWPLRF
jgi:cytoskeletal protein RodZ